MIMLGDRLERMREIADNSVDSIVTDPPYGLKFLGAKWDYSVPSIDIWKEALRVLKPGGHLLSFGGTRTYHRMVVAIEDAGFEIRDSLQWLQGQGFPKNLDISKAIDKAAGAEREVVGRSNRHSSGTNNKYAQDEWTKENSATMGMYVTAPSTDLAKQWKGWGTALKPACEIICLARKPLEGTVAANTLKWGCGGLNIDESRIEGQAEVPFGKQTGDDVSANGNGKTMSKMERIEFTPHNQGRWPSNVIFDEWDEQVLILQDSIPEGAKTAIKEYYADYCKVSNMRPENGYFPKSERPQEVLQQEMLLQKPSNATGTNGRQASHAGMCRTDDQDKTSAWQEESRPEQSDFQGSLFNEGLSSDSQVASSGCQEIRIDVSNDGPGLLHGASASDGAQAGTPAKEPRDSSSQKRKETRQSGEQSRTSLEQSTQSRALESVKADKTTSLFIRESDVPQMWLRYFNDSGFVVKAGAAAMLDEQSGVSKSQGGNGIAPTNYKLSQNKTGQRYFHFGDIGGASRFFYCAKTSKNERNAGLDSKDLIWESELWEKLGLNSVMENIFQHSKDTSADILVDDKSWSTDLYGHSISEQYPQGMIFTIEMVLKLITELKTSNASQSSSIKENIQDAIRTIEINGLSLAESAQFINQLNLTSIREETAYLLGVVRAVLPMLLTIKGFAKSGNFHNTVKPIKLMQYLIKLITPPKGTVLDPFMGSGSTGVAAKALGYEFIGIEMNEEYVEIAKRRIG